MGPSGRGARVRAEAAARASRRNRSRAPPACASRCPGSGPGSPRKSAGRGVAARVPSCTAPPPRRRPRKDVGAVGVHRDRGLWSAPAAPHARPEARHGVPNSTARGPEIAKRAACSQSRPTWGGAAWVLLQAQARAKQGGRRPGLRTCARGPGLPLPRAGTRRGSFWAAFPPVETGEASVQHGFGQNEIKLGSIGQTGEL